MTLSEISCPECQSTNYRVHVTYQTQSGEVRQEYRCLECGRYFAETTNTPLARLRTPLSKIVLVLESLNEGSGINAVARIFRVSKNSIYSWMIVRMGFVWCFQGIVERIKQEIIVRFILRKRTF